MIQKSVYKNEKIKVLSRLNNFTDDNLEYSLVEGQNKSLFATIFAIYIKDLFNYDFSEEEKNFYKNYFNKIQSRNNGFFYDPNYLKTDNPIYDKKTMQLTTFILSAFNILGIEPLYEIRHNLKDQKSLNKYLNNVGVRDGKLGSGNFAMFAGILISDDKLNSKSNMLDYWFQYHDSNYNKLNGVWTAGIQTFSQWSYQNALHQLMIYEYWEKDFKNSNQLIDIIIKNVDKNGTFSLLPGGGACCDYDAIHILNVYGIKKKYRENEILSIFNKTYKHLLKMSNQGFCENNYVQNLSLLKDFLKFYNRNFISTIFRIKEFLHSKRQNFKHHPHWSKEPISLNKEDLWSIWFRLLVISEIESATIEHTDWKFQHYPGLGILKKQK